MGNILGRWRQLALASCILMALVACGGGTQEQAGARESAQAVTAQQATPQIAVVSMTKTAETRVSRTVFDLTFQVQVKNTGNQAFTGVTLSIASVGNGSSIIDGQVTVGNLAAGASITPTDTITIRHDRSLSFDSAAIVWSIMGSPVTSPQAALANLEDRGLIPRLERGPSIQGTDANANGVRDDIDALILTTYPVQAQQKAALQVARALQRTLSINTIDPEAAKTANLALVNAIQCVYLRFAADSARPPAKVAKELLAVTTNTKERLRAYLAFSNALNGTSWATPTGDTCD